MQGKILRWGNSYAIRLPKADLEAAGLHVGDEADVTLDLIAPRIDVGGLPTFRSRDDRPLTPEIKAEAMWHAYREKWERTHPGEAWPGSDQE